MLLIIHKLNLFCLWLQSPVNHTHIYTHTSTKSCIEKASNFQKQKSYLELNLHMQLRYCLTYKIFLVESKDISLPESVIAGVCTAIAFTSTTE